VPWQNGGENKSKGSKRFILNPGDPEGLVGGGGQKKGEKRKRPKRQHRGGGEGNTWG